jgi:hypothetical protein
VRQHFAYLRARHAYFGSYLGLRQPVFVIKARCLHQPGKFLIRKQLFYFH